MIFPPGFSQPRLLPKAIYFSARTRTHGVTRQDPRIPLPTPACQPQVMAQRRTGEDEDEDEEGASPREEQLLSAVDTRCPAPQPEMQEGGCIFVPHKGLLQVILNHK